DEIKGEFDLRSRKTALRGGESGEPAIVPGKPDASPLYQAVRWDGLEMPPKENDRLTGEQIELIRQWIAIGAPWDDDQPKDTTKNWSNADGVLVKTSGGLSADWTNRRYKPKDIWAYEPIAKPSVPAVAIDSRRVYNPIDAFIQARLQIGGIKQLAGAADARTFIRRAT